MHVLKTCHLNFGKSVHVLINETFNIIVTKVCLGEKFLRI